MANVNTNENGNFKHEEFSFNKTAEHYHQEIIRLNFSKVECEYKNKETGALLFKRDVLCVDYKYINDNGAVTSKRLFPRYAFSQDEIKALDGKELGDILYRHGFTIDPDTGEEIPAENKWTAYMDLDGQWSFLEGRNSDWDVYAALLKKAEEAEQ